MEKDPRAQVLTMSREQHQKAIAWMLQHAPNLKCSVCLHDSFNITPDFISPKIILPNGDPARLNYYYPLFMVVCDKCGHIIFMNAIKAGLIQRIAEPSQPPESPAVK